MEKGKIKPGKLTKGILIVAQQLLVMTCIVSLVLFACNSKNPIPLPFPMEVEKAYVNYIGYTDYGYGSPMSVFQPAARHEDTELFGSLMTDDASQLIRYCVIREQFETDAAFDAKKKIDIKQYATRKDNIDGQQRLTEDGSASYYLEDLISWSQYGMVVEYIEKTEWEKQWNAERTAADKPRYEDVSTEIKNSDSAAMLSEADGEAARGAAADEKMSEAAKDTREYLPEGAEVTYEITEPNEVGYFVQLREDGKMYVPVPRERYRTVDGKTLADYTNDAKEYAQYVTYLQQTIQMIDVNYTEYQAFQKYYDEQNLNLKYYITLGEGEHRRVYTNLTAEKLAQGSSEMFSEFGRYLYYEPTASVFNTNIPGVYAEFLRNIWQQYMYAFSEPCTIRIGMDTSYPHDDNYKAISDGYAAWSSENAVLAKTAVISGALAVLLLAVMTLFAGRKKDTDGVALTRFDKVNTETALVISFIAATMLIGLFGALMMLIDQMSFLYDPISGVTKRITQTQEMILLSGGITGVWALVANGIFAALYLSLVRRLKAHTIISNSLLVRFCKWMKRTAVLVYTNGSISLRTVVAAMVIGALNIFCSVLGIFLLESGMWLIGIFLFMLVMAADIVIGVLAFEEARKRQLIVDGIGKIKDGNLSYQIETKHMHGENLKLAEAVNSIGEGIQKAVETSMKDERTKADLITNVSHDIKTPLTSIISYVDLLKRENIQNETVKGYIGVLDMKSQRLKQLTEDLVEASKISSGNITLDKKRLNLVELLQQTAGEFEEKFRSKNIQPVMNLPEQSVIIEADSRRMWRIIDNLYNNIAKYALEGTRAYIDLSQSEEAGVKQAVITMKNISAQQLNIEAEELTERFIRGDVSRSTEGSGLGLSIARNLAEIQNGVFHIYLDGDLFKVTMSFPLAPEEKNQ